MARLQIEYWNKDGYNARRYGKPWIAKVVAWDIGAPPQLKFGRDLEIDAEPGDVVRWGQKDNRNPRGTRAWWGIVALDVDGKLSVEQRTERQAREHWRESEASNERLYETLLASCRPDSPNYDRQFHENIYQRQPQWFNGDDGLSPPVPPASASELN